MLKFNVQSKVKISHFEFFWKFLNSIFLILIQIWTTVLHATLYPTVLVTWEIFGYIGNSYWYIVMM